MSKIKVFEFFGEIGVKTQQAEEGLRNVRDNAQESANGMAISFKKAAAVIGGALAALGAIDIGKKILGKGWDRLIGIDTATAKLTALGHSAQEVDVIMDNALQSVRGTAFGLESAATAAASAVAAGIEPGQELERYLSLVGDTAAIAGAGFEEMGSIFNKVMTSGVIQSEELNQLGDRGIPIFKMLADEMGVSQDQIRELASEGAISSEIFLAAIESGFGGAAKTMGELSLSAAIDNVWASVGRLGAAFLGAGEDGEGMFQQLKPLLGSVTSWIDSLAPKAEKLGAMFGNAFSGVIEGFQVLSSIVGMFRGTFNFEDFTALNHMGISSDTITSWQSYAEIIKRIGYVFRNLFNMIKQPISNYLNRLKGHFDGLFDGIEGFDMQEMLVKVYQFLVQFQSVFQEAVDGVMDFMEPFFDYWERGVENIVNIIKGLGRAFQQIISGDFRGALNTLRTIMTDSLRSTGESILTLWSGVWEKVVDLVGDVDWAGVGRSILSNIATALGNASQWIGGAVRNIITAISDFFTGEGKDSSEWPIIGKAIIEAIKIAIEALTVIGTGLIDIGKAIVSGLALGLLGADNWGEVEESFLEGLGNLWESLTSDAESIFEDFSWDKLLPEFTWGTWQEPINELVEFLEGIPQRIKDAFANFSWKDALGEFMQGPEIDWNGWDFWNNNEGVAGGVGAGGGAIPQSKDGAAGLSGMVESIRGQFDEMATLISAKITEVGELGTQYAITLIDNIQSGIVNNKSKVTLNIEILHKDVEQSFDESKDTVIKTYVELMSELAQTVNSKMSDVLTAFRSKISDITQAGRDTGRGFYDGLASQADRIVRLANSIAQDVASTIRRALDTRSPSKVGFNIFRDFGQGLYNGLDSMRGALLGLGQDIALDTSGAVRDNLSSAAWNVDLKSHREDTSTILMTESFNQMNRKLDWLEQLYYKDTNTYMDSREVSRTLVEPLEEERRLLDLLNKRRKGAW